MGKMRESLLVDVDRRKLLAISELKRRYNAGELSLDEGRAYAREHIVSMRPYEYALSEQEDQTLDPETCKKEDIQAMLELFQDVIDLSRPDLPPDHPISHYYLENEHLRKILLEVEDLVQYPMIRDQWVALYGRLLQYRIHFQRKQNQLYPILMRYGFDRPNDTMWLLDDYIWKEMREARDLLQSDPIPDEVEARFIELQGVIVADLRDIMQKEETVLLPTSLALIPPEEFEYMQLGDREIGFAWIDVGDANVPWAGAPPRRDGEGFIAELGDLMAKYGYGSGSSGELEVTTGSLTLDQINLIYQHVPIDLTFVDEHEIVRFYTDTTHRIFPRSRNVIGRLVENCHPQTSVHVVKEIVEKFRNGTEDKAEFWINRPDKFIYICFFAVRDGEGRFRGILEMMQDCLHIRSLEGSRTLLTWESEQRSPFAGVEELESGAASPDPSEDVDITPDTRLLDLFERYPSLRARMKEISPHFKQLETPLARVMLPKATIRMMSKRSGIAEEALIQALKDKISGL